MRSDRILTVDPRRPGPEAVGQAAGKITAGGVVVFPTRGLYGLGADAFNLSALERVYRIKQRPENKPILVLVRFVDDVLRLAAEVPETARRIMDRCWPGRVTLVFAARPEVPGLLTAGSGKLGIRLPGHPVAAALVAAAGGPITGTSANIAGEPGVSQVEDLSKEVADRVDLILDAGPLEGGAGSTVVDVTVDPPRVLREGAVPVSELESLLRMQR